MRKLLRPSDIFLLGLAGLVDVFEEIRDPLGIMAYSCQTMYGWIPEKYKKHNFVRVVERQLKTGNIEKTVKNGEVYLRLTSIGQDKIKRDFSLMNLQKQVWDRKWRIVMFDIAEISKRKREVLRRKLKELGFGMLQKSVWISPHDIVKDLSGFIETKEWQNEVYIMEVNRLLAGNERILAENIWHLENLNDKYLKLLNDIKKHKDMYVRHSDRHTQHTEVVLKDREKEKQERIFLLKGKYLELLLSDPFLPKELLPNGWVGEEVRKEIGKI